MPKFFKKHSDLTLIFCSVIFLAALISYFFWGITTLVAVFNKAIAPPASDAALSGYDLSGAAKLDLKGLGPTSK